ncbi:hypothetical protein HDU85_001975, partial [Gaertneriomyces sp. JEL0708]
NTYHYDISTTDAHAASYRPYALNRRGGALTHRENDKTFKYKGATDLLPRTAFIPAIFDAYGGIGPQFETHLKIVTRFARDNCLIDYPHEWMRSLLDTFSCTIVKANADMCLEYNARVADAITSKPSASDQTPSKKRASRKNRTPAKSNNKSLNRSQSSIHTPAQLNKAVSKAAT